MGKTKGLNHLAMSVAVGTLTDAVPRRAARLLRRVLRLDRGSLSCGGPTG